MKIKTTLIALLMAGQATAQVQTIGNPHNTVTANGRLTADSGYVFTARDSAAINAVAAKYNYSTKAHNDSTYIPKTNTITVNGSAQTLGSNPSFTVGGTIYPGYGTKVRGGDSIDVDTSKIAVKGAANAILDTLYSKSYWTNLSDFTTNGSTSIATPNGIAISNSSSPSYTHSLDLAPYTLLEKWILDGTFKVGAKNASSYGVGLGIRSYNASGYYDAIGRVDFSNSGSGGYVMLDLGSGDPQAAISSSRISFSVGDIIELCTERDEGNITVWARNLTTNSARASCSFTYPLTYPEVYQTQNTGKAGVFSVGTETDTLKSLSYVSKHLKNPNLLIVGASKGLYFNTGFYNTWPFKLAKNIDGVECTRGGYDKITHVLNRLPEILRWNPKNVLLYIGDNDIRVGVSATTYIHNYDSLVSGLLSAGIVVYHIPQIPEFGGLDQHLLYNHITTTYPQSVIDPTNAMSEPGMISQQDNIHLTDSGNETLYRTILYSGKIPNVKAIGNCAEVITKADPVALLSANVTVGGASPFSTSGYDFITGGGSNGMGFAYSVNNVVNYVTNNDAIGWQIYSPDNGHIPFRITHSNDSVHFQGPVSIPSNIYINGHFNFTGGYIPSSSGDTNGNNGDFSYDNSYMYIKSAGSWKRIPLNTF